MKTIAEMRAYTPSIPDDFWEEAETNESLPEEDQYPVYEGGYTPVVSILFESTIASVLYIRIKKTDQGYQVDAYDPDIPEQEYSGFLQEYKHFPSQGAIFDVFADMRDEGIEGRLWVGWMSEYETLKEVTDFISMESDIYPDVQELMVDFYRQHGFQ